MTPLATPVVPEEYGSAHVSEGEWAAVEGATAGLAWYSVETRITCGGRESPKEIRVGDGFIRAVFAAREQKKQAGITWSKLRTRPLSVTSVF